MNELAKQLRKGAVAHTDAQFVINDIINWNKARYAQEYNGELQYELLYEEIGEYTNALSINDKVEVLDGLCDVFYICVGALWKAKAEFAMPLLYAADAVFHDEVQFSVLVLTEEEMEDPLQAVARLVYLAQACQVAANLFLRLTQEQFFQAVWAVCESNNTKPIKKTASHVKAAIDKGAEFVPPTKALQAIIDAAGGV